MATKFFGFRLSKDQLNEAAEKIGYDQVSVIAKRLLIEYLSTFDGDSTAIADHNTDDMDKKKQPDRLDQIESNMADILTRVKLIESKVFDTNINQPAAIATDIDILPEVTMNKRSKLTPRKELLALLGLDDKAGTKYIKDTFKRVTGVNPVKADLSYPVGMLNYLKENPDILSKKPA